jgi:hypothetical protein
MQALEFEPQGFLFVFQKAVVFPQPLDFFCSRGYRLFHRCYFPLPLPFRHYLPD